jgi:glutamate-1-semialdehyde 2,1-aminomutase
VRYARTGGESMAIAARIARAYTGRDTIAFCGYHGWADWYLAANLKNKDSLNDHLLKGLEPKGVPQALAGTMLPFHYNKIEELEAIVEKNPDIAAIFMEPMHSEYPQDDFLQKVRAIADRVGALLVFDEITIGWRLNVGGAHLKLGVNPDIAVFAKGMGNGFPMAAIIGKKEVMEAAQDSFISSTYWTEGIGPTATIAAIKIMQKENVPAHLAKIGGLVREVWLKAGEKHGLKVSATEVLPLLFFTFPGPNPQAQKTLFTQEMLKRGILASGNFYASFAHQESHVERYAKAVDEVFAIIAKATEEGSVEQLLEGPIAHSGFERLN